MQIDLARDGLAVAAGDSVLQTQVCIIGGGIAGLLVAARLAEKGIDVVLLEAGGAGIEPEQQALAAAAELAGHTHRGTSEGRTRALGGNSLVWGGQLLPLPEGATWPVPPETLTPYYAQVEQLLGADDLSYAAEPFFAHRPHQDAQPWSDLPHVTARLSKFVPFRSRNLGRSLGRQLLQHRRARVLLHAAVTALHTHASEDRIETAMVHLRSGTTLQVQAAHFVLAAGTVETCRLLLASKGRGSVGLGNDHGQVGLNFHDHLTVQVARFTGAARSYAVQAFRPWVVGGLRGTLHAVKLEPDTSLRRELDLNPVVAHVTFEEPIHSGAAAVRRALRERQQSGWASPWHLLRSLPVACLDALRLEQEARVEGRRYVSPEAYVTLRINVAQRTPSPSSVSLSGTADAQGQPLARVDWRVRPEDLRSVRVFAAFLQAQWAHTACGPGSGLLWRPELLSSGVNLSSTNVQQPWGAAPSETLDGLDDARHAMGGACMGHNPHTSVVDADLRVHGLQNLSVASAAVFPDGQAQLPTLTLMALALRLADQVLMVLRPPR